MTVILTTDRQRRTTAIANTEASSQFNCIHKVQYEDPPPSLEALFDGSSIEKHHVAMSKVVTTKCNVWSYEYEWRFVVRDWANKLKSIGDGVVSAIYFGARMCSEHKDIIKNVTGNRLAYFDACLNPATYKITFEEHV